MSEESLSKQEKLLQLIEEKRKAEKIIDVDEKRTQVVIFLLANEFFGCYGRHVKGIVSLDSIAPVPGTPAYILGLTNVRGDIEAVVDLKMILNLPETPLDNKTRLILTQMGEIRTGILVDRVEEVTDVPESQIIPPASVETINKLVAGEMKYKNQTVVLIDLPKLFQQFLTFG